MSTDASTYTYAAWLFDNSTKAGRLRTALVRQLAEHVETEDGLPTSGRFLFYELEQLAVIPKAYRRADGSKKPRQPGQDISDALTDLREEGIVPWEWIVDEGRSLEVWRYAATVAEFLRGVVDQARVDLWNGHSPPLVLTESRSLAGVLRPIARDYLTPISSTAGQSSGSLLAVEIAPLLIEDPSRYVIYFGDFDFQGDDIEHATRRKLEEHVGQALDWQRLAITAEQVEEYGLTPIEKTDHRFRPPRKYEAVETEALRQHVIVGLLREHLDRLLPTPLEDVQVREQAERQRVADYLAAYYEEAEH
jgi:hypothetical protein